MKKFLFFKDGQPAFVSIPSNDTDYLEGQILGEHLCKEVPFEVEDGVLLSRAYLKEGEIRYAPESPGEGYFWNIESEVWEVNIEFLQSKLLARVSLMLRDRLYLPCNGFDANKVSRERISGMIARLQRGDGLPAGWVGWRDASNQQQWVEDDAATVLVNLIALSLAIEDREQALLVASWTHKTNIATLTNIDAIISYETTQGWPD